MMFRMKEILNYSDAMKNKTNKPATRKIWPMPGDQEEWAREVFLQRMTVPPSQPRSRNLLRPSGFIDAHDMTMIDYDNPESFHCAIGSILIVAQFFGLLPVSGVRTASPKKLVFKKMSLKTIYAVVVIIMIMIVASIAVGHMIQTLNSDTFGVSGGIASATAGAIFYGNGLFGSVLFIWLAPRWPSLQRDWRGMEQSLDRNKHRAPKLRWKFSLITAIFLGFALLEHILSLGNNVPSEYWSSSSNLTLRDLLQSYSETSHAFIFSTCDYNLSMGIFIFISSKVATFTWNFTDVFIMLLSTGLAERYKNLNKRLVGPTALNRRDIDWLAQRSFTKGEQRIEQPLLLRIVRFSRWPNNRGDAIRRENLRSEQARPSRFVQLSRSRLQYRDTEITSSNDHRRSVPHRNAILLHHSELHAGSSRCHRHLRGGSAPIQRCYEQIGVTTAKRKLRSFGFNNLSLALFITNSFSSAPTSLLHRYFYQLSCIFNE